MQIRYLIIKITGLLVFNLVSHYCCIAQHYNFSGLVLDKALLSPVQYASIFIKGSDIGVYSNEQGVFQIEATNTQILVFSHVGYRSREIKAKNLPDTILLSLQEILLPEIEMPSTRLKRKVTIGIRDHKHRHYFRGYQSYAVLINSPIIESGFVKSATFRIGWANVSGQKKSLTARLRIRVYAVDPLSHVPSHDLLQESVIVDHKPSRKYHTIDLERYSIPLPKNGLFIGIDVLGYIDQNNEIVPYSFGESSRHLVVPMKPTNKSATYCRTFGRPWKATTLMDRNGMIIQQNASFSVVIEY